MRNTVYVLLGAVALVLLIACVNVANLILARSAARRKEVAVRAALGAGRIVIVRQLLVESLLLAAGGSALGLLLSTAGIRLLRSLLPWGFDLSDLRIDLTVLAFTAATAVLTALLFGAIPALQASKADLTDAMRTAGRSAGPSVRSRFRNGLIVAEVALSLVLLAGAGLLIDSFRRLVRVDAGLQTHNVVTMEVAWPYGEVASFSRMGPFYKRVLERIEAMPGVESAGGIWVPPMSGSSAVIPIYRADRPVPERGKFRQALYHAATPGYFQAAGIRLVKGRLFTEQDGVMLPFQDLKELRANWAAAVYKVVVSETMARRYWPGDDPIGKRFRFGTPSIGGPWLEIVGIVGDVRHYGLHREPEPEFYFSAHQEPRDLTLFIRTAADPGAVAQTARGIVRQIDPNVPVGKVQSLEQVVESTLDSRRTNMLLLACFAGLALLLAAVGIYGVVSYTVSSRVQEFGIRMALGATRRDILSGVLRQSAVLAAIGCAAGLLLALPLSRFLANLLYGVSPTSPPIYCGVAALLFAVAMFAGLIPARRATRVDPMNALRQE
jgi:putative ABC transport system permease protein